MIIIVKLYVHYALFMFCMSLDFSVPLNAALDRFSELFKCLEPDANTSTSTVPVCVMKIIEQLWPLLARCIELHKVSYY